MIDFLMAQLVARSWPPEPVAKRAVVQLPTPTWRILVSLYALANSLIFARNDSAVRSSLASLAATVAQRPAAAADSAQPAAVPAATEAPNVIQEDASATTIVVMSHAMSS